MKFKITSILLIAILIFSCKKKTVEPTAPSTNASYKNTFIKTTIDGISVLNDENDFRTAFRTPIGDSIIYSFSSSLEKNNSTITITFENNRFLTSSFNSSDTPFLNSFYIGEHKFYSTQYSSTQYESMVNIYYSETINGETTEWYSYNGDQTNSTFNVTEKIIDKGSAFTDVYVKGTFSCKVYNISDLSLSKTLTDGTFNLAYTNIK